MNASSRETSNNLLYAALAAMLGQQVLASMTTGMVPVLAPMIADDLGVGPAAIGGYLALYNGIGIVGAVVGGSLAARLGGIRTSQISLLILGLGLAVSAPGWLPLFGLVAVLTALGYGPMTPSSSQVLSQYAPPRLAPLIFSIKQAGVPLGNFCAGIFAPMLAIQAALGWQGAMVIVGLLCICAAIALQGLREKFDRNRQPDTKVSLVALVATIRETLMNRELRNLSFMSASYAGLQFVFVGFVVTQLVKSLGYTLTDAGFLYGVATLAGVVGRIGWGWLAGRFGIQRQVLGCLGIVMAATGLTFGLADKDWSYALVFGVTVVYSGTVIGWHGVWLSEVARVAPPGQAGRLTGGVISISFIGSMAMPTVYGAILGVTGSYFIGYAVVVVPVLAVGMVMLFSGRTPPASA